MSRNIKSLHPFVIVMYVAIVLVGLMVFRDVPYLVLGLVTLIINFFAIEEEETIINSAKGLVIMCIIIILLNPLFNRRGETVLFYFYQNPVTLEAVILGVQNALSLTGLIILFIFFDKIMSTDGLLYLMSRMSKRWAMLVIISLNFVPALKNKITDMQEVQRTKRVTVENEKLLQSAKTGMVFIEALLNQSLEDAMIAADSMTARGYGSAERSHYHNYKFYRIDWLVLILLCVACIWQFFAPNLIVWAFICLTPTLIEGSERLKWHFYQ